MKSKSKRAPKGETQNESKGLKSVINKLLEDAHAPKGTTSLHFDASASSWTAPEVSAEPVKPAKSKKAKAEPKPEVKPEPKTEPADVFSLEQFLSDNLEAKEGEKKVITLDIVERYLAAAKAAGKPALPKFAVQRNLRPAIAKLFPNFVYSNSTPNGYKGVVWKAAESK